MFQLVKSLAEKDFVTDLALSRVLLEDNRYYPWVILVPRRKNVKNMTFLTMDDRIQLMREIALAETIVSDLFSPDQINTAAIGNLTPQLHVHVIARKIGDPDWPGTVWNQHNTPYNAGEKQSMINILRGHFQEKIAMMGM